MGILTLFITSGVNYQMCMFFGCSRSFVVSRLRTLCQIEVVLILLHSVNSVTPQGLT